MNFKLWVIQIKEKKYRDAIDILNYQSQINSKSRAALSLLAHCYYHLQDYVNASDCYEQLSMMCPEQEHYKLYYAQALYKCGLYSEAMKVTGQIESKTLRGQVNKLQSAIKYAEDDIKSCVVCRDSRQSYIDKLYNNWLILGVCREIAARWSRCWNKQSLYSVQSESFYKIIKKYLIDYFKLKGREIRQGFGEVQEGSTNSWPSTRYLLQHRCLSLQAETIWHCSKEYCWYYWKRN